MESLPPIPLPPGVPPWLAGLGLIALAVVGALAAHAVAVRLVRRALRRGGDFLRSLVVRTRAPGRLAICVLALSWALRISPVDGPLIGAVQHALALALVVVVGWGVKTAIDIAGEIYQHRIRVDTADNLMARKRLTQVRILRRAAVVVVLVLTFGVALMTLPAVRQVGLSILAAGGAAGIIVGLALQPILSNLMAGVQIALTQPIRLDDAVVIDGEFGNIEEINSTYVVVRLWDLRRLIVPVKYFLDRPFQNWTRQSSELLGVVLIYVDYTVPVDAVRARLDAILAASPLWDRKAAAVQVTDARERTVELRALVSAADSGKLFDLRCAVREQLLAWLQREHPQALPQARVELQAAQPAPSSAPSGAPAGAPP